MLKIGFSTYGIDLFGGYAHPTAPSGAQFASFFAFGVLHAPLGGVPAFFVTGIGIGFGINRELHTPTIDEIDSNPFMLALRALGPAAGPDAAAEGLRAAIKPAQGEYWVAAGISFTSFVLVTGEILVTVQFGDGLEIAILGLARAQLPDAGVAAGRRSSSPCWRASPPRKGCCSCRRSSPRTRGCSTGRCASPVGSRSRRGGRARTPGSSSSPSAATTRGSTTTATRSCRGSA